LCVNLRLARKTNHFHVVQKLLFARIMRPTEQIRTLRSRGIGTVPVIIGSCGIAVLGLGLWTLQRGQVRALEAGRAQTTAALNQANRQIQDLTQRLNLMDEKARQAAEAAAVAPAPRPVSHPTVAVNRKGSAARAVVRDSRFDRLQGQLTETRKELATTRQDLSKAQDELDGKIASTRDDLTGSIAKNHDEVVALQKRGEQNIYEFTLSKSKEWQRVGPISLSLRGTSTKHKTYDFAMLVDDNSLNKKHVNLYEPVWVTVSDRPQPLQLVINRVGKNEVAGYLSEPKYRKSELAGNPEPPAQPAPPQLSTR
jgi:hypothetical protein